MNEVTTNLANGSVVRERYVVEKLLGKGGFGAVYLVRDIRVKGNRFALKEVIDTHKQDQSRFRFEGDILKRLDHPSLPRVYRTFDDDQLHRFCMLMDYVEGPNLEILRQQQPEKRFPLAETIRLMNPIMDAVIYLHQQQPPVIHRDIKPANIIVPSGDDQPVLVDFGIAKEYDIDDTTTAVRRLSPNYGAPEQYTHGTNPRTDIYGLGATFYALLTGSVPTDAFSRITHITSLGTDSLEPMSQHAPDLPSSLLAIIHKAMEIDMEERFSSVEEFKQALQPYLAPPAKKQKRSPIGLAGAEATQSAPDTEIPWSPSDTETTTLLHEPRERKPARRRNVLLLLLVLIIIIALATGTLLFRNTFVAVQPQIHHTPVATVPHHQATPSGTKTATRTVPTATPQPTSPPPRTTQPTSSPPTTQPSSAVPSLRSTYTGSIHNASANIDGNIAFSQIQQQGSTVNGLLTMSNGLSGQSNFTTTIQPDRSFSFQITPYTQYLPLLFRGKVNSDGSLSGTYCSVRGNQCDYSSGGFGTWNAAPVAQGSINPSELRNKLFQTTLVPV